jgi:uncharacterized protein
MQSVTTAPSTPSIGFGPIRHARLAPAYNAFSYAGLFVRLPMHAPFANTTRLFARNRAAVLSFWDRDHGDGGADAAAWLRELLQQHGVADANGALWLHTFPRMFGYVFKPVSFWFAHRADGALRAIVAEVNNTFGERHCYLLEAQDGAPIKNGQLLHARKVFHVSPFCEVRGRYEFRFFVREDRSLARIDYFDGEQRLLETSIAGEHHVLNTRNAFKALTATPWFTLGVIAKIHWQALKLWLKRVPFVHKPNPPSTLVSR